MGQVPDGVGLDRASPVPLWRQLLDDLRSRLSSGEFGAGFPSEATLTSSYGVSRQTVREALRRLVDDGLIDRGRGRGTFLRNAAVVQLMGPLYSLYRSAEEQGFVQESVVRHLEVRSDERAATMLDLDPGAELVYLERVRMVDGWPVVVDCSWMPEAVAGALLQADFHRTALYRELEERCGVRLDAGWERVEPVMPDAIQRRLLGLRPGVPVYGIERLARQGDRPIEWRHGVVRADRFVFVSRWGSGRVDAVFEPPGGAAAPA